MPAKTRLTLDGYGGRRTGSFAGKTITQVTIAPAVTLTPRERTYTVAARGRTYTVNARDKT